MQKSSQFMYTFYVTRVRKVHVIIRATRIRSKKMATSAMGTYTGARG